MMLNISSVLKYVNSLELYDEGYSLRTDQLVTRRARSCNELSKFTDKDKKPFILGLLKLDTSRRDLGKAKVSNKFL